MAGVLFPPPRHPRGRLLGGGVAPKPDLLHQVAGEEPRLAPEHPLQQTNVGAPRYLDDVTWKIFFLLIFLLKIHPTMRSIKNNFTPSNVYFVLHQGFPFFPELLEVWKYATRY